MSHTTTVTPSTPAKPSKAASYFDLHVEGLGYLSRIRWAGKGKHAFLACSINAMRGSSDDMQYTKFDLVVRGQNAYNIILFLEADVVAKKKVIVKFKASDIYAESYIVEGGEYAGKTILNIKGRLLQIKAAKVNGVLIDLPATADDNDELNPLDSDSNGNSQTSDEQPPRF